MLRHIVLAGWLGVLLLLPVLGLRAAEAAPVETDVTVEPVGAPATGALPRDIAISFRSGASGHLVRAGQRPDLTAVIVSPVDQTATVTLLVTGAFGAQVYLSGGEKPLAANTELMLPVDFPGVNGLPNGAYRVEVWAAGTKGIGYAATALNVWIGPLDRQVADVGISYVGPLTDARTWRDLDLFRDAGVGWLRFPLNGWLPQGQAVPEEAETYNKFVQEAGLRGFSLLAAFTPRVTVDPSVDAVQADKEYRESLLAAATRYSFKVKDWDLLPVKPDARFPGLQGINSKQLASGEKALKAMDKTLNAIFSVEAPFRENALELFNYGLPAKGEAIGLRYNYSSIPEVNSPNAPPLHALGDLFSEADRVLKRTPAIWMTDHGFNPSRGESLPEPPLQAALMARALVINRALKVQHTFWRHDVKEKWDQPFTLPDGSVSPKYLALRTVLERLDGVTAVTDVPSPLLPSEAMPRRVWAFLLRYGQLEDEKKSWFGGKKKGEKARYVMAIWWETRDPRVATSISLKTSATRVTVTDLWGNAIELQPTSQAALITVDAFPRFVDLGAAGDVEIYSPFARFDPPALVVTEGGKNILGLQVNNDQRLFRGKITCDVYTRRWPGNGEVNSQQLELGPADHFTMQAEVVIPEGARKGQLYEVTTEIKLGTRRIGYLTLPVYYIPKEDDAEKR